MIRSGKCTPRWWPLAIFWMLGLMGFLILYLTGDSHRQGLVMGSIGILAGCVMLSVFWLLALSGIPWRVRLSIFGGLVLTAVLLISQLRFEGVTGDLRPIVKWRWSKQDVPVATGDNITNNTVIGSFPQFLGPNRNATVPGVRLEPDWETHPPELIWRRPIGKAWSGFAVSGNRAVTQEQDGPDELVVCYEFLTGEPIWEHRYPARYDNPLGGIGPRATPTIEGDRVYALGAMGDFFCLSLETGEKRWGHNVLDKHGAPLPDWGMAGSPLIYQDLVILSTGGSGGCSLVAYDKRDGEFAWGGGSDAAQWSSPVLYEIAGKKQVLIFNYSAMAAHDVSDGSILWEYPWDTDGSPHVAIPVPVPGDRIVLSSGYGKGAEMLQISNRSDGGQKADRIWRSLHLKAKFNNYVLKDGYLYGLDDGRLTCIDVETGRRTWKNGRYGHGQNLLVEDLFLLTAEYGEVLLIKPVPEKPMVLGRFQAIEGKSWNPPALIGPYLLVRNHMEAALYRLPLASPGGSY